MTPPRRNRAKRLQALTLVLTAVVAGSLGAITYFSLASLPYLATSPTTDPHFGALNACLLEAVPERLGFAVSRDVTRAAGWSSGQLVQCAEHPPRPSSFQRPGITMGTYDGDGALWVASAAQDGGAGVLLRLEEGTLTERGAFAPAAMVGTASGVVALEPSGQLISLSASGEVSASRALPLPRKVQLRASGDGRWVALFGGGRFAVVDSVTLESTPAEVPCSVSEVWWRAGAPLLVVECVDFSLEVNALTSESTLLEPRRRVPSTLLGPGELYFQNCDVLPCTAEPPR